MKHVFTLEKTFLSSRAEGTAFREKIEKLIKGKYCSITINGAEVVGLSESYADEVFGKLAKKLGKKRFFEVFTFIGFSEFDLGVIATALQQRLH
ncbi:MAG: DUF4325 domain-containing protein [Carnobacterium sp.]